LSLQRTYLFVVEGRHKVCGDFCRFLFRYGVGSILFTGFKHVLQSAAVLGRASVPQQLNRERWNCQNNEDIAHKAARFW
jgi:hypothetical protein